MQTAKVSERPMRNGPGRRFRLKEGLVGCMCETAMVSIIVPIYNVEAYLKECIDSIRGQTMQEMDIILVDDGSPDSCPQICDQFAAEDKRIRVFHRENMGVSAARNFGMEQAEADWIMFVDPDDWLEKDAVEALVRTAVQTNCEIVCGSFYWNYTGRQIQARSKAAGANEYLVRENLDFLFECVICRCDHRTAVWLGTSWGQIYRADYLKENQIYFPVGLKKSEDVVFNLSAVWHAERICILDVPVYHYRIHGGSACRTLHSDHQACILRAAEEINAFMKQHCVEAELRPYYFWRIVDDLIIFSKRLSAGVTSADSFRAAVQTLKEFAACPVCQEGIRCVGPSSLSWRKKMVYYLLKFRMYRTMIAVGRIYCGFTGGD